MQPTLLTRPVVRTVALWPWPMPFGRMGPFVLSQALLALGFRLGGSFRFWPATAAWQPFAVAQANLIELLLATGYDR